MAREKKNQSQIDEQARNAHGTILSMFRRHQIASIPEGCCLDTKGENIAIRRVAMIDGNPSVSTVVEAPLGNWVAAARLFSQLEAAFNAAAVADLVRETSSETEETEETD